MVTGQDLLDFEQKHGLTHPPYRDLDAWAQQCNQRGGVCPCNKDRICPCPESIDEIANAKDDSLACCTCRLFCDDRYYKFWEHSWKLQKRITPQKNATTSVVADATTKRREVKNPEIKQLINTFAHTTENIKEGKLDVALEEIQKEAEEGGHCETCLMFLGPEVARMTMISGLCKIDKGACEKEKKKAIERLEELTLLYEKVDEQLEIGLQTPETPEISQTTLRPFRDNYHKCMSETLSGLKEKEGLEKKDKFRVASMFCSGKAETIERAIELIKEG